MTRVINHRLPLYAPPATRGDCITGTAITGSREDRIAGRVQCGALQCRSNLLVVESGSRPGRRHNKLAPEWTVSGENTSAGAPSCVLDVVDANPAGMSAAAVAGVFSISKRRIEQITKDFKRSHKALILARLGEE